MHDLAASGDDRSPRMLVEHRTHAGGRDVRFSVYDTYRPAEAVALHASRLMFCGPISGRKTVHVEGVDAPFDVVPGEMVVVPAGHRLHIDFPEAREDNPTTSITLEIGQETIQRIVDRHDESPPSSPVSGAWRTEAPYLHLPHTSAIERVLRTLVALFAEEPPYRDALIDVNATALVLRMLQTEARMLLLEPRPEHAPTHGMAAAVQHVHNHLDRHLSIEELAEAACMSRSTFYRKFRDEFGVTPLQYVNRQRMERARSLLRKANRTVTDVSLALGFRSVSHFIMKFKQAVGLTPKAYQERAQGED